MNFASIVQFVCNKVSKTDTFSQARCTEYVLARHKMIYESFDWKASQALVSKTISAGGGTTTSLSVPEVHHVLSVRLDGKLLDPVTPSFIFDREVTETDEVLTAGTPRYYEEFLDLTSQTRSLRFFPPLADDGNSHTVLLLGKTPYQDSWTSPAIPATENALLAYATGDMWEYIHEVGKAQAKFQEAAQLLDVAKQLDTPGSQRPRQMRRLTATGDSLIELVDSVCTITGDFTPGGRNTVRELLRRCYQQTWQAAKWPETTITDMPTVIGGVAVISHLIDKVISVRANLAADALATSYRMMQYEDSSVILGLTPKAFSEVGTPMSYNILLPLGIPQELTSSTQLKFQFLGSETQKVYIRGESNGVDAYETLTVGNSLVTSAGSYDTIFTISKPVTASALSVQDLVGNTIMSLQPGEQTRKYIRIQVLPDFDTTKYADQSLLVFGKREVPQLLDDGDVAELTGCENILINTAASDFLTMQGKLDVAAAFGAKASAAMKSLIDRETSQQTYQPRILPYTEPDLTRILL